nr:MAG TPA: hypothetical protein [Bacteriophage sp.]
MFSPFRFISSDSGTINFYRHKEKKDKENNKDNKKTNIKIS